MLQITMTMNFRNKIYLTIIGLLLSVAAQAQDTTRYHLTISEKNVNITGKETMALTVNGTIPGPVLRFKEGDLAIIEVTNEMDVETSVHWHGLLLPNFYDGVPYLTTPPIEPGHSFTYEIPLKQAGTYWYHSHTMLQEQSGVYGSIVIEPKEESHVYDKEIVMMLSDWTDEKPMNVLRNLKRGNEWYNIRKGTATPLNQVIARGALGAQLNFWKQRMESADIADVYYPAFLNNGAQVKEYPDLKPGERVRLRIINGGASTQFWISFGGGNPQIISADGLDVSPVQKSELFIAIAETYDVLVTIPEEGKIELRATAQDGSGHSQAFLGSGNALPAAIMTRPDKIGMMMQMAKMDMRMGAPSIKSRPKKDEPYELKRNWGMKMGTDHGSHSLEKKEMDHSNMDHSQMNHEEKEMNMKPMSQDHSGHGMGEMQGKFSSYSYDFLKSPEITTYAPDAPVKEILLNLTGNMNRYTWSMNGLPLSETDKIKIKGGEVTRITLNNLTMMHHPMHLHGHFFRVINKNGEYSPLKHTVNVPPMQEVTIEFYGDEYGDWFFHCHVLYHMMGGMARVFSYDTPRDPRMEPYPMQKIVDETDRYYTWATLDAMSQMNGFNSTISNLRNQFNVGVEYGYNENIEAEVTYERYINDYVSWFAGVNTENTVADDLTDLNTVAVAGLRWFTPYMFNLDVRVDSEMRTRFSLGRSVMIFPKLSVFGYYEYETDFGIVNELETGKNIAGETVWNAGAEYIISRNVSLTGSYDNRFGLGAGLSLRF